MTGDFEELLAADDVDAVVIATPVPTHYPLAHAALEAGKHVFVEKPPAMRAAEMEELIGLAEARGLVLMPGHLLLYHPAVQKLKELIDDGELGEVLVVYGNRQNLGKIRKDENALWSLGVHDLSVIQHLISEEIVEAAAHGHAFLNEGVEDVVFCYLRFAIGEDRPHASVLARPAQDAAAHGRRARQDGRVRRHGARAQDHVYDKAPEQPSDSYGEWRTRTGDIVQSPAPERRAARLECAHFVRLVQEGWDGREMRDGLEVVRALELLHRRVSVAIEPQIHPTAIVYPGTVLGEGVKVLEHAVVGKQPTLSPRSTAKREELPPAEIGDGTIVSTGAVVFAGARIGARVILGDQSCVRERVIVGDDVVIGRGSLVENDTTIGAMTKIQAEAYITAYSTLEEHVFIAPCVVTTNDNFMGRTERRHELIKGPTIRRGARIGGGAILLPGLEIGEEAFVGAGAVVTKDVPARMLVVGNPARVMRAVAEDELLENR